jgi:hypothetical protein
MNGDESDHEDTYSSIDDNSPSFSNDENEEGIAESRHSNASSEEEESDSEYVPADGENFDSQLIEDVAEIVAMGDLVEDNSVSVNERRNGEIRKSREQLKFIKILVIFCTVVLFVSLFVPLPLDFSQIHLLSKEDQSPAMCWEVFKAYKCDTEHSKSRLCKELLNCSMTKAK